MTVTPSIDLPGWMAEQLSQASPDLLRQMVQGFAEALMSADADAVCGISVNASFQDSSRRLWQPWATLGNPVLHHPDASRALPTSMWERLVHRRPIRLGWSTSCRTGGERLCC